MTDFWYATGDGNSKQAPKAALSDLVKSGEITPDTYVYCEQREDWVPLRATDWLQPAVEVNVEVKTAPKKAPSTRQSTKPVEVATSPTPDPTDASPSLVSVSSESSPQRSTSRRKGGKKSPAAGPAPAAETTRPPTPRAASGPGRTKPISGWSRLSDWWKLAATWSSLVFVIALGVAVFETFSSKKVSAAMEGLFQATVLLVVANAARTAQVWCAKQAEQNGQKKPSQE